MNVINPFVRTLSAPISRVTFRYTTGYFVRMTKADVRKQINAFWLIWLHQPPPPPAGISTSQAQSPSHQFALYSATEHVS